METLKDINTAWSKDSKIPPNDISNESLRCAELHAKYHNLLSENRPLLKSKQDALAKTVTVKWLYYSGKLPEEDLKKLGWKQFELTILKTDVEKFIMADDEIITLKKEVSEIEEIVEYLKSILGMIRQRSYDIKNHIEWKKFEAGF